VLGDLYFFIENVILASRFSGVLDFWLSGAREKNNFYRESIDKNVFS
jgi:hypothetical protein